MNENWVFFKQWVKNPARLGTFLPIQKDFARQTVQNLIQKNKLVPQKLKVLELGSGTGRLTEILIQEKFQSVRAIELDKTLANFLNQRFENEPTFHGCLNINAADLKLYIPEKSIDVIISVIPLMYLSIETRINITNAAFYALKEGGIFWHVCYTPHATMFKMDHINISKQFTKWTHIPTGFVFDFKKKQENTEPNLEVVH